MTVAAARPDMKKLALAAASEGKSMNEWLSETIEEVVYVGDRDLG